MFTFLTLEEEEEEEKYLVSFKKKKKKVYIEQKLLPVCVCVFTT